MIIKKSTLSYVESNPSPFKITHSSGDFFPVSTQNVATHLNGILRIFQVTSGSYSRIDIAELVLQSTKCLFPGVQAVLEAVPMFGQLLQVVASLFQAAHQILPRSIQSGVILLDQLAIASVRLADQRLGLLVD